MAARDILKNFNLYVDGRGYAGQVTEYTPPNLALLTEDHRGGGMDGPVKMDLGMEAMDASFILASYDADVLKQFGLAEGNEVPLVARGALESYDGTVKAVVHTMRGKIINPDRGTWTPGSSAPITINVNLNYFKEEIAGEVIYEIDLINMVRIIDGVDRLQAIRDAIGV